MPLIDPTRLNPLLSDAIGRFDVDSVDAIDSTNDELSRRAARGAASGTVLVADHQEAGRGRRGRPWLSSPTDSLTLSLLWRFSGPATRLSGLSLAIGVAVARALETVGTHGLGLKWPNDILLRRADGDYAKLAGILIELGSDAQGTQAIIGIGLNLDHPPGDVGQASACLKDALGDVPERHTLLAALLRQLAYVLDRFAVDGFAALRNDWLRHHAWQDQTVRLIDEGHILEGRCRGVDATGALLIETEAGIQTILAGDVSLRRA